VIASARANPMLRCRAARRGFTLIEAIATIVILGAIATVASNILLTAGEGYIDAATRAQLHSEVSMSMDRIVREIRQIDLDNDANGLAPDIDSVSAESITWDDDDRIALNGDTIELVVDGGSAEPLQTDVSAFSIQAYDQDDAAMKSNLSGDDCDSVRRIELSITLARFGVSETLRTKVFIRSCMTRGGVDPS